MNRSWMYGDRTERAFQDGVMEFRLAALEHQRFKQAPTIACPCRDCENAKRWPDINKIEYNLYRRGFTIGYETWYWHGEKLVTRDDTVHVGTDTNDCVANEGEGEDVIMEEDRMNAMGDQHNEQPRMFEEQWKPFAAHKKSERGKQCSKGNIHHHHLGQKSCVRKRLEWIKEKRLPPSTECSSSGSNSLMRERVENRGLEWCLAHKKCIKDGKWEVDSKKSKTTRLVSQVMEHPEKEAKEEGVDSTSKQDECSV